MPFIRVAAADAGQVGTIGVQLELPGGATPVEAGAAGLGADVETVVEDSELPVEAAGADDSEESPSSPSMVASAAVEGESRGVGEPPEE